MQDHPQRAAILSRLAPHPPAPPQQVQSKGGRNVPVAVITAVVLLALVATALFIRIEFFVVLLVAAGAIALWEVAGAVMQRSITIPLWLLMAGQTIMLVLARTNGLGAALVTYILTCALAYAWCVYWPKHTATDALVGFFALGWIGLIMALASDMTHFPEAEWALATLILLPVANDVGGWLFGVLLGKHPMAPTISPKKSWEGFAGSVLLCLVVAIVMAGLVLSVPWWSVVAFAILTPACATAGDFAESLLKRDLDVKDMGSIFPGHGGMLDRIDSILFCAPLCYTVCALAFGLL